MTLLHLVILALVQGITEFLPISSSAHLILVPVVFKWPDQGLLIDVAVHVGTLGAVVVYFWREVWRMVTGTRHLVMRRWTVDAKLVTFVALSTIPVVIGGVILKSFFPEGIRSIVVIAWANLFFAALLFFADRYGSIRRDMSQIGLLDAVIFGLMQTLALIPGTSRSGVTMTAGRFLGFDRESSARFSLLMSIPTIVAAGSLAGLELYQSGDTTLTHDAVLSAGLAFVSALFAITALMAWLKRANFTPFVIYRIILGLLLLAFAHGAFS